MHGHPDNDADARSASADHDTMRRESDRLAALQRLDIVDTPREEAFERISRLVGKVLHAPIVVVSLIDAHRQWIKACRGLEGFESVDRRQVFCDVTIRREEPVFVEDTLADPIFRDNVFVTGEPHIRFYAGVPLRTRDGHSVGTICAMGYEPREMMEHEREFLVDMAEIAMSELELRVLAGEDALTGALTRRTFRQNGERAVALAQRSSHPLSAVTFDLDHFKRINDTHGHAVGDEVLKATTTACGAVLRPSDIFGRVGGEEFALILPQTAREAALTVAERLREAIAALRIPAGDVELAPTASFGVAELGTSLTTLDALLVAADRALYEAKATGRNRCVVYSAADSANRDRREVMTVGSIRRKDGPPVACTLRSMGPSGAGLDVWDADNLPATFELALPSEPAPRACRIVARAPRHVEVEFAA